MSAHGHAEVLGGHDVGSIRLFSWVWVWLLLLTALEVFLAYERLEVHLMITILVGLSLIKSALIMNKSLAASVKLPRRASAANACNWRLSRVGFMDERNSFFG